MNSGKPINISSGGIEPAITSGKPINISSGGMEPRTSEQTRLEAIEELISLGNLLGVDIPQGTDLDSIQDQLREQADQIKRAKLQEFDDLSPEALVIADELMSRRIPLPDQITDETLELALRNAIDMEEYKDQFE